MNRNFSFTSLGLLTTAIASGCMLDEPDDELDNDSLGEIASELNLARWAWAWGTTDGPDLDLGPATDRTCFLSGVSGNLNAGWGWDNGGRESEAAVRISDGRWKLTAAGGHDYGDVPIHNRVNAHAVCIGTTTNRIVHHTGGAGGSVNAKVVIAPVTASRQCFLRDVSGYSGTWASSSARVRVFKENGNWVLESANLGTAGGIPGLGAVCVDMPPALVWSDSRSVANPGVSEITLVTEGANPLVCGLTGIAGPLKYNEWDDGALIKAPDPLGPGPWKLRLEDGKTGYFTCVE